MASTNQNDLSKASLVESACVDVFDQRRNGLIEEWSAVLQSLEHMVIHRVIARAAVDYIISSSR